MSNQTRTQVLKTAKTIAAISLILAMNIDTHAATTDLAPAPLITTPTASVLPNVFLMIDDSGSMGWDYMPDNAGNFNSGTYGAASSQCNGVFYNPSITYITPVTSILLSGAATVAGSNIITFASTATLPAQPVVGQKVSGIGIPYGASITAVTATQATLSLNATANNSGLTLTVSYPDSSYTNAWKDGYNPTTGGTVNLSTSFVDSGGDSAQPAFYYAYSGTQTTEKLKDYYNTASTFYKECNSSVAKSTISISGTNSTSVTSITVGGVTITSGATTATTSSTTQATAIASLITLAGYSATASGSTVTIYGPAGVTATPVINKTGTMTITPTAFTAATTTNPGPNVFSKVLVSATSGAGATDERTNFANWYSYYHTRTLMMKTATGLAFHPIDNNFRVGMATMNNNKGTDFVPLDVFDTQHKHDWYAKVYGTSVGNSTPLRDALANVGKMYAMKLPSNKFNTVTVTDPIEYSCQQNFTILTTDGFWNQSATANACTNSSNCALAAKLTTGNVGNQDGTEIRPMYDGTLQAKSTSQTLQTDKQNYKSTNQLQAWTQQLQTQTSDLQQQTGPLQWQTNQQQTTASLQWQTNLQSSTASLQWKTNVQSSTANLQWQTNLQQTTAPLQWQTNLQTSTASLQWSTNLQKTTAPLQWQSTLYKTTAPLQWATNLQKTTQRLAMWTDQMQVTASLQKSTLSYTATVYPLNIGNAVGGPWSAAAANTTYNCITTGTASGTNKYCQLGAAVTTTTGVTACTSTFANPGAATTDASKRVTVCSAPVWSAPAPVGANGTCTANASTTCSTGVASAPAYVTNYPVPSCTVNFNAAGSNTADASGNVITSCPTDGGAFASPPTPVPPGGTCDWNAPFAPSTNTHLYCFTKNWGGVQYAPQVTNYVTSYPPTCATYTVPASGMISVDTTGSITLIGGCTAAATPSTPTAVAAGGTCTTGLSGGWLDAVQCSTGATTVTPVTTYAPTCATNFNAGGASTADASGKVITACTTGAPTAAMNMGAGGTCNGALPNVICLTGAPTIAYIATYPPTCAINFIAAATTTADASGNVITACPVNATYSGGTTVAANSTCNGTLPNVQCLTTGATAASYIASYPPTCTPTFNGAAASSTTNAAGKVTLCPVNAAFSAGTAVGANGSCNPSFPNVQCLTGAGTTAYVATYPPTCAVTGLVAGALNADASGKVVVACPINAAFSTATTVAANSTCDGTLANVNCLTSGATAAAYIASYPPTCTQTFNGATASSTTSATGKVTLCSNTGATYSTATTVAANSSCDGTIPGIQCLTSAASAPTYIGTYPPTCPQTYNAAGISTTNATGKVTVCSNTGATYSTATTVAANSSCDGTLANVKCLTTGATTAAVTTYPPACTINFNAAAASTTDASGKVITACPNSGATYTTWANTPAAGSCTPGAVTGGGNVNCQYAWSGTWANAASCTTDFSSGAGPWTVTTGTKCQYTPFTAWSNYASSTCTTATQSAASPFTVGTARNCQVINVTTPANTPANPAAAWIASASCTATTPAGTFDATGKQVQCQNVTPGPTLVATCSPIAAASGNSYTATTCSTTTLQSSVPVQSCTAGTSAAPNYVVTTCQTNTTGPTNVSTCIPDPATAANNWLTTSCNPVSGGTYDTLADVAEYYYMTDLRTLALGNNLSGAPGFVGIDISNNNVPSSGLDSASHQHMTTFTLGLGARGRMVFDPSYQSVASGDYYSVKQGSTANAATGVCSWQADNTICNWPIPKENAIENVDDLWHAAVNGRGTYFSAANPSDLSYGLSTALAGVSARRGSAAAATTSTAFITQKDNFIFHSSFVSLQWTGDLSRQQIDVATGKVLPAVDWSAQGKLDLLATPSTSRNIYFLKANGGNNLSQFLWGNLNATQQGYFGLAQIALTPWAQFCTPAGLSPCLSAADQNLAIGANLVNFIRGDATNTGVMSDNTKYYRQRLHTLGDIVDSESAYVKLADASYKDPGYSTFKTSTAITTRNAMVYVGANDGMLHAIRAADDPATAAINEGGQEDWAYIPSFVMPDLYRLADKDYGGTIKPHHYFVDGSPVSGDVCVANCANTTAPLPVWKTILVGGLNLGGKGFYALDVTDPANPKALWEFTDANMGYSYGNPKIVKLKDGTWVVLLTSGYNNADGQGHLYVLDAYSGTLLTDISTGVGTNASPSGLARIDNYVISPGFDATIEAVYGGDLEGNVWRFDINGADTQIPARWADIGAPGIDVQALATLKDTLGNPQPITSKPLITLNGSTLMVIIGTGKYLGSGDPADTSQQSFYAMKDTFGAPTAPATSIYGDPRTQGTFVQQLQAIGTCPPGTLSSVCTPGSSVVLSTNRAVTAANAGWYFDFAHTGERVNTNPDILSGTIALVTNVPSSSSCSIGGDSYVYFINFITGGTPGSAIVPPSDLGSNASNLPAGYGNDTWGVSASKLGNEIGSNPILICLPDGRCMACVQGSGGGDPQCREVPPRDTINVDPRRVSWRELMQ